MLAKLIIKNFAIIDQLEIDFRAELNIITGETGAGKSIILGALGLLLGNRADVKTLKKSDQKCIIEGHFELKEFALQSFFKNYELDYDDHCILRREISTEGKSRAFINDTPVNLQILKELGEQLVDIHAQHETLSLNNKSFQLSVLDSASDHKPLVLLYQNQFKIYSEKNLELQHLIQKSNLAKLELDYIQFQFDELNQANIQSAEQIELEQEQQKLIHAEEIKSSLQNIYQLLSDAPDAVNNSLKNIINQFNTIEKFNANLLQIKERVSTSLIELKDIASELESIANETNIDPSRLEIIEDRLNLLYKLQQKHRVNNNDELIQIMNQLDAKLVSHASVDEQIEKLSNEIIAIKTNLTSQANQLSINRAKASKLIEVQISLLLQEVGMPNAVFLISMEKETELKEYGIDKIQFLFSANKGFSPSEISKVASGGELSRLMLCIKSMIAKKDKLATIIFDEIDTGVSGEVANKVGQILKSLSKNLQVISITHLPQIAGFADAHFFVYKEIKKEKTYTNIRILSEAERILEIAKMLSGDNPSNIAIENAKELLK